MPKIQEGYRTKTDLSDGIEITSVGTFLDELNKLREKDEDYAPKYYFRGQQVEYWDVYPSIFRLGMLNSEHQLLKEPLEKLPDEFSSLKNTFDLMTKCQHYGLCTRLLDLTTNPLVALYFACQINGEENYLIDKDEDSVNNEDINIENAEPCGLIFYKKAYPVYSDNKNVKIVTELAKYDLQKENSIENIINRLYESSFITIKEKEELSKHNYEKFLTIIQSTYVVQPTNNNSRLTAQSGAFLLPSMFYYKHGLITKCKGSLRKEFEDKFFYIEGCNKQKILDELNMCNINESTLFPELEHQLKYIKTENMYQTFDAPDFERYEEEDNENNTEEVIIEEVNPKFISEISEYITSKIGKGILAPKIIQCVIGNSSVDWYKKESILSKIQTDIMRELIKASTSRDSARFMAKDIIENAIKIYSKKQG